MVVGRSVDPGAVAVTVTGVIGLAVFCVQRLSEGNRKLLEVYVENPFYTASTNRRPAHQEQSS